MKNIQKLISCNTVKGLPMLKEKDLNFCGDWQIGKQVNLTHPILSKCSTQRCFELLHMGLIGPIEIESLGEILERKIYSI